ncbi:conserved protein, unknown function [Hepatocystis sp. ex Piliocolobus tephrosceles]|nr:conserved protein, unknown function [Hepatocystis sp. ex Piliocolobus tephrosceles]
MATNSDELQSLSEKNLKKIYYEHFIDELNDEELMYKKTVEDLFYIYKSFGFIYSIIKKANLLLDKESFDMFIKSLVSFIDELLINNPNIFEQEFNNINTININNTTKDITSTSNNTLLNKKRKIEQDGVYNDIYDGVHDSSVNNTDTTLTNGTNHSPNNINMNSKDEEIYILTKCYIIELLNDINIIDEKFSEKNSKDFLFIVKHILKIKKYVETHQIKNRFEKIKKILTFGKTIFRKDEYLDEYENKNNTLTMNNNNEKNSQDVTYNNEKLQAHEFIEKMINKLTQIEPTIISIAHKQNFWYTTLMKKSEYDSLNSVLNLDLEATNETIEELYTEVIQLFSEKMTTNEDLFIMKEKLERLKNNYDAEIQRKIQQEMELSKKLEDKRKAVQFIIDRYNEYTWFDKNSPKKHSFYILGINPTTITEEQIKSFGKRLKHILHPDKEPNKEWKVKAETAFKEASLAILGCQKEFRTKILKNLEMGPEAPYLSLIGIDNISNTSQSNQNQNTQSNQSSSSTINQNNELPKYYPTQAYYPKFELKCVDQKIGTILIDIKCPVQLGVIKKVILYVHRPIYGTEPLNLIPDDSFLSFKHEQNVNIKNLNQPIETRVDFVQPLEIAASTKYYIGIQLIAERGNTMINWNSINITLHKFSNKNIIKKLLSSFINASFINQAKLNAVLSNENKDEMTKYLNECISNAKTWAQTV